MSLEAVQEYFRQFGMEKRVMSLPHSTATVALAAEAHNVEPGQICKTLSFKVDGKPMLILTAGDKKIDNRKYKDRFSAKAKMLTVDEVVLYTGHEIGGVCPFGIPRPMPVYLDISLKEYSEVLPAAGDSKSAIRLSIAELEQCSNCTKWVDVCK